MLQGICVNPGQSAGLEKDKKYYLFPNGLNYYYVSNFPNPDSHLGCFQALYFQIMKEDEWPPEPTAISVSLDPDKVYLAKLIWRKPGYKFVELKDYYIRSGKTHADIFKDIKLKECFGCLPLHWFVNFKEVQMDETVLEMESIELNFEENELFFGESEPKTINYVQLSLFD